MDRKRNLLVDVGIFAFNEELNIKRAVSSVLAAETKYIRINQIIVVSSGSYDHTNVIVRELKALDKRVVLIEQAQRKGKSSAINLFLRKAKANYVITMSADVTVKKNALDEICLPLFNTEVGMVGAHPVPQGIKQSEIGTEIKILWELHHMISLINPKCGEMIAYRNLIREIPPESAVDEATIEVLLKMIGYTVVYAPLAIVYNRGPKTIKEYITQRRRVFAGHEWVIEKYQYKVVTMDTSKLVRVVLLMLLNQPHLWRPILRLIIWEVLARILGYFDYRILHKNPYVWQMIARR